MPFMHLHNCPVCAIFMSENRKNLIQYKTTQNTHLFWLRRRERERNDNFFPFSL